MKCGMHCASTQHQFTVLKRRAGRGKNLPANNEHDVTWKKSQIFNFFDGKKLSTFWWLWKFCRRILKSFCFLKSSVVRDFKCGLELCCLKEQNKIFKQFPRTSEQTVSAKKNNDSSKNEQILRERVSSLKTHCAQQLSFA